MKNWLWHWRLWATCHFLRKFHKMCHFFSASRFSVVFLLCFFNLGFFFSYQLPLFELIYRFGIKWKCSELATWYILIIESVSLWQFLPVLWYWMERKWNSVLKLVQWISWKPQAFLQIWSNKIKSNIYS